MPSLSALACASVMKIVSEDMYSTTVAVAVLVIEMLVDAEVLKNDENLPLRRGGLTCTQ